jgi:hypothetical protein
MDREMASKRLAAIALAMLAAVGALAASAGGRASGVDFTRAPGRAVQGNQVTVAVSVRPAGARCSLSVRYADGSAQRGLGSRRARDGRATWTWRVSRSTRPGAASVTASCAGAGSATRTVMIIGQLLPLKIEVVKKGFSVRNLPYGGTRVSYGVILRNESKRENAQNLSVLVNFVMADNRLIGSASTGLMEIRANTEHAVGGDLTFPGGAPIARLEVVVQVAGRGPATRRTPGVSAVRVVPDIYEPEWVGSVEGEIANDDQRVTLKFARMSAVVLDADGNVLGGAGGFATASLPPGTREFFKLSGSLNAIPIGRAASALVSVEPMYSSS